MFKFFFGLVAITTIASMGFIGKIGSFKSMGSTQIEPAPVVINASGSVSFPGRVPNPETVYELRRAIQMEDVETINKVLVQNHLFMAPGE